MLTLPGLLSAGLWILGLAGVLATLSYVDWRRGLQRWRWGQVLALPRLLSPFYLSVTLFCTGMALSAITNPSPVWWQIAAWSVLAILFAASGVQYTLAGRRNGWDTPIEGTRQP
jgi:hypothetical protein